MANVKTPQDHKPKKQTDVRKVTVDGIPIHIDPAAFDDYMIVHQLAKIQDNPVETDKLLSRLLGADQFEFVLMNLASRNDGRIPGEVFTDFLEHLFNAVNPNS